jgi:uncharacterized protein
MALTQQIKTLAMAAVMLGVGAVAPAAAYDTINCQRDTGPTERAICASQRLQVLDAQVTEYYTDIMLDSHIKGEVKRALHDSQVAFLKRREQCGTDGACLAEVMERRASRINFYR